MCHESRCASRGYALLDRQAAEGLVADLADYCRHVMWLMLPANILLAPAAASEASVMSV